MSTIGRQIAKGASWIVAMRLGERLLGLISTVVLARLLMPEDFGLVAMATSVGAILEALSAFGFEWALIQRRATKREYFDTCWTLNIIVGGGNALVLLALALPAAAFYEEPRVVPIMLALAFATLIGGFRNIGMMRYEQDLEFSRVVALTLGRKLASFAVTLSVALYLRSYWALVAGLVAGAVVDLLLSFALHSYRPKLCVSVWRELFSFSKWLLLNSVLYFLSHRGSDLIIGKQSGPAALGTYSIAYELANLPTTELVHPVARAAYPGFAKMSLDAQKLRSAFTTVFGALAAFTLPAATGIACLANPIVEVVLGDRWKPAAPILSVLALLGAVRAIQGNTGALYMALGKPQIMTALNALYVAIALPSLALLLGTQGLVSAVWALFACASVTATVNFALLIRHTPVSALDVLRALTRPALASAFMAAAVLVARYAWWSDGSWPMKAMILLMLVLLGMASFAASLLGLWIVAGRPEGAESAVLRWLRAGPNAERGGTRSDAHDIPG